MSIKLISVNIERNKHLDTVLPFLEREQPDVLCLQELFENHVAEFEHALSAASYFVPMHLEKTGETMGLGIFSRLPISDCSAAQYAGERGALTTFLDGTPEEKNKTSKRILVGATIDSIRILTTHFTWTPDGQADDFQRADVRSLVQDLEKEKDFVLCGDFNAPRGGEIFSLFAARYTDTIPTHYQTSLDPNLHRVGPTLFRTQNMHTYMVDGLFSTPAYQVSDVRLEFGVSDHAAVVATIDRVPS